MLPHQHRQPPKPNQASAASKPTGMDTKCYLGSLAFYLFTVLSMSYQVCKKHFLPAAKRHGHAEL